MAHTLSAALVRGRAPALACATLLLCAPMAAHAQFGGLIKKAAEKVAADKASEKVAQKASSKPRAAGEALSEATLSGVLTGAKAAMAVLADRDRYYATQQANQKTLNELVSTNEGTRSAYNQANSKILDCRDASLESSSKARTERMEKMMKDDAKTMERAMKVAAKYSATISAAQQKGDTAAMAKAQLDMQREILGFDIRAELKADTAKADAACGKLPAKPATLLKEEQLQASVDAMTDSLRIVEARAVTTGAKASGLEQVRYLELKERALTVMRFVQGQNLPVSFADEEVALVKQRMSELETVKPAL